MKSGQSSKIYRPKVALDEFRMKVAQVDSKDYPKQETPISFKSAFLPKYYQEYYPTEQILGNVISVSNFLSFNGSLNHERILTRKYTSPTIKDAQNMMCALKTRETNSETEKYAFQNT